MADKKDHKEAGSTGETFPLPDPVALTINLAHAASLAQQATGRMMESEKGSSALSSTFSEIERVTRTLVDVGTAYAKDPTRIYDAQLRLWENYFSLAQATARRMLGDEVGPLTQPARGDKRFRAPEWQQFFIFDLIKQAYLLSSSWLIDQIDATEEVDEHKRKQARFFAREFANALSPSNFLLTNPEVLRTTLARNGENLVLGMQHLLEDVEKGDGKLVISQTDESAFEVGVNIAATPGKVVYQNDLVQLIQYEPTTEEVYERPLVIFPPWINKYYILDLTQEKSFVKWATDQGYTVFVVSWVNPDEKLAAKTFEDYMQEGIYDTVDAVQRATGADHMNAIGYCIGGTMLSATLARMAAQGDDRITSATFFAAQVDFKEAGELQVFIDEDQLKAIEDRMADKGYMEAGAMVDTFNVLRSNDLIWSYVVNNYLLGKDPMAFDLLYWNGDATRLPARMHAFYLRQCYLNNNLAEGRLELGGVKLDMKKVTIPIYMQASREDHIAPFPSIYRGAKTFGGPVRFMLAGSGHIAGVINPPVQKKYQHWLNDDLPASVDDWIAGATEVPGSWWENWDHWLSEKSGDKVPARHPGDHGLNVIEDAPGSYVKVKATGKGGKS